MKKILFATDFSSNANKAFEFALNLAEKHQAQLIMLHVFDIPPIWTNTYMTDPTEMIKQAVVSWEGKLKELFDQYDTELEPTIIALKNSSTIEAILSVIDEHDPDLIVTGVKGKNMLREIFVGSTTKALLKKSPIPLLAIPENANYKDFKKVIYASDFQYFDINSLEQFIEFVMPYKPDIKIIHICTDDQYKDHEKMAWFKDLVRENISYKNISFELLLSDNLFAKLNSYIKRNDFDLIVMLEKERFSTFDKLFHEDLVWKMEFNTSIPLLSYNERFLQKTDDQEIKSGDAVEH
ncbi:MAG: universal stress protein [Flavobacteriales bacterium]|nr:universal stress protein [Flavobacteriales bacterium]